MEFFAQLAYLYLIVGVSFLTAFAPILAEPLPGKDPEGPLETAFYVGLTVLGWPVVIKLLREKD